MGVPKDMSMLAGFAAKTFLMLGNTRAAFNYATESCARGVGSQRAQGCLALIHAQVGQWDRALFLAESALAAQRASHCFGSVTCEILNLVRIDCAQAICSGNARLLKRARQRIDYDLMSIDSDVGNVLVELAESRLRDDSPNVPPATVAWLERTGRLREITLLGLSGAASVRESEQLCKVRDSLNESAWSIPDRRVWLIDAPFLESLDDEICPWLRNGLPVMLFCI